MGENGFSLQNSKGEEVSMQITRVGYEGDFMGGDYIQNNDGTFSPENPINLSQINIDLLAQTALDYSAKHNNSNKFVLEGEIEKIGKTPRVPVKESTAPPEVQKEVEKPAGK